MKNSTAVILILISAGLFYTFFSPQYARSKQLSEESAEYRNVLENVSALSRIREELTIELASIPPADIANLEKILPDNTEAVRLALDLDSIGSRYGIAISDIEVEGGDEDASSIAEGSSGGPYGSTIVSFKFVSTYGNFRSFMSDIERSLRIIDVRSVSFQAGESNLNEYQVSIETYSLEK